ncbi:histidinol phosphatase [Synechococcus moorigangaii CMS01]|nr:histidinol phosphatase [Synechococcus moorigangaii CMS01]
MGLPFNPRIFALLKVLIVAVWSLCCWGSSPLGAIATELKGSIDFHVHSAPDVTARLYDDLALVEKAAQAGMAAIVLKNHVTPTADRAVLAHKVVPGIEVYGGVVLNETVGGLNLRAVETMDRLGEGRGKVVWLPTIDAAHHRQILKHTFGGLRVARYGHLVPEMSAILQYIAEHGLVLGTGHIAPEEILTVVPAAKQFGVEKILVTHAMATVPGLNLEQMQAIAHQGAFLELTYVNTLMGDNAAEADHQAWDTVSIATMVEAIQTIGPEHFVLSTDLGRALDPSPIEGYQAFLDQLAAAGITESDLTLMRHINPKKLLQ